MKFRNFIPALVFLVIAIALAIGNGLGDKPNFLPSMVGKEIPEFTTAQLGPKLIITNKDLTAKPSIINFWASWCVSCKAEHEELLKLKKEGFQIYGINSGDNEDAANEYLKKLGNPFYKIGVDPRRKLAVAFGTTGLPETFVVGTNGKITYHYRGALTVTQVAELKETYAKTK